MYPPKISLYSGCKLDGTTQTIRVYDGTSSSSPLLIKCVRAYVCVRVCMPHSYTNCDDTHTYTTATSTEMYVEYIRINASILGANALLFQVSAEYKYATSCTCVCVQCTCVCSCADTWLAYLLVPLAIGIAIFVIVIIMVRRQRNNRRVQTGEHVCVCIHKTMCVCVQPASCSTRCHRRITCTPCRTVNNGTWSINHRRQCMRKHSNNNSMMDSNRSNRRRTPTQTRINSSLLELRLIVYNETCSDHCKQLIYKLVGTRNINTQHHKTQCNLVFLIHTYTRSSPIWVYKYIL